MTAGGSTEVPVKILVAGATGCGRGDLLRGFAERIGGVPIREGTLGGTRIWRVETMWPQPLEDGRLMRLRLFAATGKSEYNASDELLVRGLSGIVCLLDVAPENIRFGWDAVVKLSENLRRVGLDLGELPLAVQYHRTDRHFGFDAVRMDQWLGLPPGRVARFTSRSDQVDREGGAIDSVIAQIAERQMMQEAT
jgi:hypothetical protein